MMLCFQDDDQTRGEDETASDDVQKPLSPVEAEIDAILGHLELQVRS